MTAAKQANPEAMEKVIEQYIQQLDLSGCTTRDFKQEYRSTEASLRENFLILADTLDTDPSLKPYLVVTLKALSQMSVNLGSIVKENVK
jgi:hypothetical protein